MKTCQITFARRWSLLFAFDDLFCAPPPKKFLHPGSVALKTSRGFSQLLTLPR